MCTVSVIELVTIGLATIVTNCVIMVSLHHWMQALIPLLFLLSLLDRNIPRFRLEVCPYTLVISRTYRPIHKRNFYIKRQNVFGRVVVQPVQVFK